MGPVRAEVTPKADAWVEAARLRRAIQSAGFKPGDLRYTVTGTLTQWRGQPALRFGSSERLLVLQAQPAAPPDVAPKERPPVLRYVPTNPPPVSTPPSDEITQDMPPEGALPDIFGARSVEMSPR